MVYKFFQPLKKKYTTQRSHLKDWLGLKIKTKEKNLRNPNTRIYISQETQFSYISSHPTGINPTQSLP